MPSAGQYRSDQVVVLDWNDMQMGRFMSQKRIPVHIQKQGADVISGTDQQSLSCLSEAQVRSSRNADGILADAEITYHIVSG